MIKDIPQKYKKIIITDYKKTTENNITKYYSYLTKFNKTIAKITVAIKKHKNNYLIKQVAIHTLDGQAYARDMSFNYISGYTTYWYNEIDPENKIDYSLKEWYKCDYKWFNPYSKLININFLDEYDEYKYSCYNQKKDLNDILKFLRFYKQYPEVEILMKLDLEAYSLKTTLLKKLHNDKTFRKYIFKNKDLINKIRPRTTSIITAYNKNKKIEEIEKISDFTQKISGLYNKKLKEEFKQEKEQLLNYITNQNISIYLYNDYFLACDYLKIDVKLKKNRYPKDFMYWHNIRINQKETKKAEKDKEEQKRYYKSFQKIINKYKSLEQISENNFITIIAKTPNDLKIEGKILHHCVGSLNYDRKIIDEKTLIFFIRKKTDKNTPYVTLEYSINNQQILQCYGINNTKPDDNTLNYINQIWLPFAQKTTKKILKTNYKENNYEQAL